MGKIKKDLKELEEIGSMDELDKVAFGEEGERKRSRGNSGSVPRK
ncbi:MAG: hypothetical protein ACYDAO_01725 [Thermoplasmataceae archaeon]